MRMTFLLLILLLFAASVLVIACNARQSTATITVVQDLDEWKDLRDRLKPTILTGEWYDAEIAWRDINQAVDRSNSEMLELWIDLQVEIVDQTAYDRDKLLLRKLALQELEFYPDVAIKYQEWAKLKYENQEFSDPEMQEHLNLILERFEHISQEP